MSIEKFVTQALNSELVKDSKNLTLEKLFELAFEIAVNVGKTSSLKQEKIDLLVSVLKKVLEELKTKDVSLSVLKTSTADSWEVVSEIVESVVPVVFSHLPVMDMPRSLLSFFSCLSASCVKVEKVEKVEEEVVEKVEEQVVEKVEEQVVEKVEEQVVEKVEKVEEQVEKVQKKK
jgi:hypothetical protein